jgi:hypothetical protein
MLRAKYWESTAVQELRVHAEALARHLSTPSSALWATTARDRRWAVDPAANPVAASP